MPIPPPFTHDGSFTDTHVHTHAQMCTHMHTNIYTCKHMLYTHHKHMHIYMHARPHTHLATCMHTHNASGSPHRCSLLSLSLSTGIKQEHLLCFSIFFFFLLFKIAFQTSQKNWPWWCMPTILALRRQMQEDYRFEASLGYAERPCMKS
jgi:hypothetical protein